MEERDSAEKDSTERETEKPKNNVKPWKVVIPFAVITAAFYAQGRAYYEGYLDYLGISPTQLPLSTTDAYWEALKGWVLLVGKGVPAIWDSYPLYLMNMWKPLLAVVLMISLLWFADRYGWRGRVRSSLQAMQVGEKLKKGRFAIAILAMITWMLSVPVLLMGAMLTVALFIVALVVPFDDLGHLGAQRYCETAASSVPAAHFSVEGRATGTGEVLADARLLQCGSDFCALIKEGETFVVRREAIKRADGVPVGLKVAMQKQVKKEPVPLQDQLCYRPDGTTRGSVSR